MVYEEKLLSKGQSAKNLLGYCSYSLCDNNCITHNATMIRFKVSVSFPVSHVTSVTEFFSWASRHQTLQHVGKMTVITSFTQLSFHSYTCVALQSFSSVVKVKTSHVWVWCHVLVRYQIAAEQKHACPSKKGLPESNHQPLGALFDLLELPIHNSWQNTWELEC